MKWNSAIMEFDENFEGNKNEPTGQLISPIEEEIELFSNYRQPRITFSSGTWGNFEAGNQVLAINEKIDDDFTNVKNTEAITQEFSAEDLARLVNNKLGGQLQNSSFKYSEPTSVL